MNSAVDTSQVPGRFAAGATRRTTGLRREIGFIGLLWASGGSIIVFPLWWDMVAVAVFSLLIYAWALRSALPADKIEELAGPGYVMPAYQSPNAPSAGTRTDR